MLQGNGRFPCIVPAFQVEYDVGGTIHPLPPYRNSCSPAGVQGDCDRGSKKPAGAFLQRTLVRTGNNRAASIDFIGEQKKCLAVRVGTVPAIGYCSGGDKSLPQRMISPFVSQPEKAQFEVKIARALPGAAIFSHARCKCIDRIFRPLLIQKNRQPGGSEGALVDAPFRPSLPCGAFGKPRCYGIYPENKFTCHTSIWYARPDA